MKVVSTQVNYFFQVFKIVPMCVLFCLFFNEMKALLLSSLAHKVSEGAKLTRQKVGGTK